MPLLRRRQETADTAENNLKHELELVNTILITKWPFLHSIMRRCRIIADTSIDRACVNARNEMRVNPDFMKSLDIKSKTFVYLHEALHIGLFHAERLEGKDSETYNLAADSVVNAVLQEHDFFGFSLPFNIVTANEIASAIKKDIHEVRKMSVEEQYYWLMKSESKPEHDIMRDLSPDGSQKRARTSSKEESKEEFVIQEGDPQAYSEEKTKEERRQYWKDSTTQALIQAKMAGKLPAGVERMMEEFLKPKADWKSLIKKQLLDGLGSSFISCWKRPSRKHQLIPGVRRMTKPTVRFLVDTSGSISNTVLQQFFGEMNAILRNQGRGVIIPWDAIAYDEIELRSARDLAYRIGDGSIKGGGGTVLTPALEKVLQSMKQGDVVVVLTDGDIADIRDEETQSLLCDVVKRSSSAIFATVRTEVSLPQNWRRVKIDI